MITNISVSHSLLLYIICIQLTSLQEKTKIYKNNDYDYIVRLVRDLYNDPCLTYRLNKNIFIGNK